ncbi:DUF5819 family protein [Allostreptomyces psammosilenae]|uniref:Uncharacterized protein n=1 Tax=Allostreptomyces psammosilenae TaxID=1892865 RepID=A0A852ZSI9_9ACTN|nr:DUF5819 family protein [Allostreptomyces psammosilenae]NYI05363.1 hypothetical protein [Allostreptomyces psammosilenae]
MAPKDDGETGQGPVSPAAQHTEPGPGGPEQREDGDRATDTVNVPAPRAREPWPRTGAEGGGPATGAATGAAPEAEPPTPGSGTTGTPPAPSAEQAAGPAPEAAAPAQPVLTARLSLPSLIVLSVAAAALAVATCAHLFAVFLHVAPSNTASERFQEPVDDWIYPEFEQNWRLFAPNPLQQDVAVHARVRVVDEQGDSEISGWVDLTQRDVDNIRGSLVPSHVDLNILRRAWSFYTGNHDAETEEGTGPRSRTAEDYMRRIAAQRFGETVNGGRVVEIQLRGATTPIPAPPWTSEQIDTTTQYRELPWWPVSEEDYR